MKLLLISIFFFSTTAFAANTCINLEEAKQNASLQTNDELEGYVMDDLIASLTFDKKNNEYSSTYYFLTWPGGYEGTQLFVSCTGEVTFWSGCSGDCD